MEKMIVKCASFLFVMMWTFAAMASEGSGLPAETTSALAWGAAVAIGLAALGGAIGQGMLGGKAMESFGRNPGASKVILTPMILGLALIESLVIYALIIAFVLSGKIVL